MRMLGYPPGWLEEAKKQVSGLMMFDKHGKGRSLSVLHAVNHEDLKH